MSRASKQCIARLDSRFPSCTGPGSTLTIVVGGAAESLSAHPGTADLVLRRRLGFIKLAIREGADLVPVFSFGENDVGQTDCDIWSAQAITALMSDKQIFAQLANPKGTKLYKIQKKFQSMFGFTLRKSSFILSTSSCCA